jgi:hypothetical protein
MNRKPERGELQQLLDHCHLAVGTWSPGDGQTRYRFFQRETIPNPANIPGLETGASSAADYHAGDGLFTALGRGEAVTWLRGYRTALQASRRTGGLL